MISSSPVTRDAQRVAMKHRDAGKRQRKQNESIGNLGHGLDYREFEHRRTGARRPGP